ncbi:MAG: ribonuclease R [Pseudomonadales bacterium]
MPRKRSKTSDPFASREAANYENPIPSREFIIAHLENRDGPASLKTISAELKLTDDVGLEALRRRMNAMLRDGQLLQNRRGDFCVIDRLSLLKGRVQGHKDGYGFFINDEGGDDLFINFREMNRVFDGDRVLVRASEFQHRGKDEAVIVEILERAHQQLVGRLIVENGVASVAPENRRICQNILISEGGRMSAEPGQMVMVELKQYPEKRKPAVGKVIDVLGEHMAPGMEIDVALRAHDIPFEWPDSVTQQLKGFVTEVTEKDAVKRVDLRKLPFVTIDGEDARDFDDAVYAEFRKEGGWTLWVAIADVSHYVAVGSALDKEAYERGTSVYFPEQVIPMLPELLSNGLCSLNPHVDRLTMACEMTIAGDGEMLGYRFCEAVIHSHARLTYNKVNSMLMDTDAPDRESLLVEYQAVVPHLQTLQDLFEVLQVARVARGAIDFETTEVRMMFGEDRKIERIVPVTRNDAHKLIEECMLCANVAAADFLDSHKLPGLYRVHGKPSVEKLNNLREFLDSLGLRLEGEYAPRAANYRDLLAGIKERPDARLIQTVLLRSMLQAVYSPDNEGHFGLSFDAYAHFTSPIRRYPDLLVHRAIRSVVRSRKQTAKVIRTDATKPMARKDIYPYTMDQMEELGAHCSTNERRADEAVRDVMDWLKCEYMQERVGDTHVGVITGVTAFGLFIELNDVYVEGLLHISALKNDYYQFDGVHHCLQGERFGVTYQLGDSVEIRVARVNLDERKIDFELASDDGSDQQDRNKAPRRKQGRPGASKSDAKPARKSGRAKAAKEGAKRGKAAVSKKRKPAAKGAKPSAAGGAKSPAAKPKKATRAPKS